MISARLSMIKIGAQTLQLVVALGLALSSQAVQAEDWPTFRGADRTGVSAETNLLDSWGENGPELLWTATGAGRGYASPAISNGRIYTLGDGPSTASDKDEYLTCFSAEDGKQLWRSNTGSAWNEGRPHWQGSRSTPTVDGDKVYVITPYGKLICANTVNGSKVWMRDFKEQLGGKKHDGWGYSESPLVDGDKLLCTPGGPRATVVALDKETGALIWKCARAGDVGAGHSSIVVSEVGGQKVYVQNTGGGPMGIAADTGKLLWSYDISPPTAFIPSPIIKEDYVFSVAGYKTGGALLQQIAVAGGSVSIKEIYGPRIKLANKHGGVLLIGDHIYGGSESSNLFYCAELMTGEVRWQERGPGSGSISVIAADGKLYLRFEDGVVSLVDLDPNGFEPISSFTTPGSGDSDAPSWAHPVIANGKLLLREGDAILCYQISKD